MRLLALALFGFLALGCGLGGENSVGFQESLTEADAGGAAMSGLIGGSLCDAGACYGEATICSDSDHCVECLSADDCDDESCSSLGLCGECTRDDQCGTGDVCDLALSECTPKCESNDDCSAVCDLQRGLCVECLAESDCSSEERCHLEQHRCGECAADADCGGEVPRCDPVDLECISD